MGKTIACDTYRLKHPPVLVARRSPRVPVVAWQSPPESGNREMFEGIHGALRYQLSRGTLSKMRSRVYRTLKACQVEMLIVGGAIAATGVGADRVECFERGCGGVSMREGLDREGWIFRITPISGESFGHYLGRFRRANCLSRGGLAEGVGIEVRVVRGWEAPSMGHWGTEHLSKISAFLELSEVEVISMLPEGRSQLSLATRLCPECYREAPIHKRDWQRASLDRCDRHHHPFLTACPACGSGFRLPALWESGCCECCWLPFQEMHNLNQVD